jgi:hypothetical protein
LPCIYHNPMIGISIFKFPLFLMPSSHSLFLPICAVMQHPVIVAFIESPSPCLLLFPSPLPPLSPPTTASPPPASLSCPPPSPRPSIVSATPTCILGASMAHESSEQAPFTSEIVGSILATDSCETSQSTLLQKLWVFSGRSDFLL